MTGRLVPAALAALVLLLVAVAPPVGGLTPGAMRAAAVALVMAALWVSEALPLAVTATIPLVAFPVLGIATLRETAVGYADPVNLLMIGGFALGHAVEEVGLHRRFADALLRPLWVRSSPQRALFAVMVATAALSAVLSNTATMLMMVPIARGLAARSLPGGGAQAPFLLGAAYAATIGGCATLIGTPPNTILAGMAPKLAGATVSFAAWAAVGVPFVALVLPVAWLAVGRLTYALPNAAPPADAPVPTAWGRGERDVLAVAAVALAAWMFRAPIDIGAWRIPGWSEALPGKPIDDAWVAVACALVLFFVRGPDGPVLQWERLERAVPWSVPILFGGGFALADGLDRTGLGAVLAGAAVGLGSLPGWLATWLMCATGVVFTEFVNNTSATQLTLPIVAQAAKGLGLDPLAWMIPATLAASCGFMMPAGTAANAIAVESGGVRPADMVRAGFVVNVWSATMAAAVGVVWWPVVQAVLGAR